MCRAPCEISRSPRLAHKAPVMQAVLLARGKLTSGEAPQRKGRAAFSERPTPLAPTIPPVRKLLGLQLLHCEMFRATCLAMFWRHCGGTSFRKHFTL